MQDTIPVEQPVAVPEGLRVIEAADGASITVSLFGGQVCSWRGADGTERLYLSPRADWSGATALRGGVPVSFPQFASEGPMIKHGFARLVRWSLVESASQPDGAALLRLELRHDDHTRAIFPFEFRLQLIARFTDRSLEVALLLDNTGTQAFEFTAALHTYLRADRARAQVAGLEGCRYLDSADGRALRVAPTSPLSIDGNFDRFFFDVRQPVILADPNGTTSVTQQGFPDVVVWNPGAALASRLQDLPPQGFEEFVCVESAQVERPAAVGPGETWRGAQTIEVLR